MRYILWIQNKIIKHCATGMQPSLVGGGLAQSGF